MFNPVFRLLKMRARLERSRRRRRRNCVILFERGANAPSRIYHVSHHDINPLVMLGYYFN